MSPLDARNSIAACAAAWRRERDDGLAFLVHECDTRGALLLRRWYGARALRPHIPQAVGVARRPASLVSQGEWVTATDGQYWLEAWVVSGGGQVRRAPLDQARPVAYVDSHYVGAQPNVPTGLAAEHVGGGKVHLHWLYNPANELVPPLAFDVFSGSATMDWATPVATVDYVPGVSRYGCTIGPYAAGAVVWATVLARSVDDVYSLVPGPRPGEGGYVRTNFTSPARCAVAARVPATSQVAPGAPMF